MKLPISPIFSKIVFSAVLAGTGLFAAATVSAETVIDFESSPKAAVESNSHADSHCEVVADPAESGNLVLKLSWKDVSGSQVAGRLSEPGGILFQNSGVYEITARINLEQCPPELKSLGLRLVDGGQETYQYTALITTPGEPGWTEMRWIVNTDAPLPANSASWGLRVDGVMDFPVRFLGFGIGSKNWSSDGGALFIDDISAKKISD